MADDQVSMVFVVETTLYQDGNALKALRPGPDGYYDNFPVAVVGATSRNNTNYEPNSFIAQITGANSFISMAVKAGQHYGEFGHPKTLGLSNEHAIARLLDVYEDRVSHSFRKIIPGKSLEKGGMLINASFTPMGPNGQYLAENLSNPYTNTAFSLRSLASQTISGGVMHRSVKKLVTFDHVLTPGFSQASKAYAVGNENFKFEDLLDNTEVISFDPDVGRSVIQSCALESFTDYELRDIFGDKEVGKLTKTITVTDSAETVGKTRDYAMGLYQSMMRL